MEPDEFGQLLLLSLWVILLSHHSHFFYSFLPTRRTPTILFPWSCSILVGWFSSFLSILCHKHWFQNNRIEAQLPIDSSFPNETLRINIHNIHLAGISGHRKTAAVVSSALLPSESSSGDLYSFPLAIYLETTYMI